MTTLSQRLDDYLAVRRGLGYDLSSAERVLRRFTEFADGKGADHITVELFLRWKDALGAADNNTWSTRLSMVRVFARWLLAHDERTEVPPRALLASKPRRARPYIYTGAEISKIVAGAAKLPSRYGLRGWTCSTLFGLIATSGLRINEAPGLDDEDVDLDERVITVRCGKNGKARFVPIVASTGDRLRRYRAERVRLLRARTGPFFRIERRSAANRLLCTLQLRGGLPGDRAARGAALLQTWPRTPHPRSAAYLCGPNHHGLVSQRARSRSRDDEAQHLPRPFRSRQYLLVHRVRAEAAEARLQACRAFFG
jgi:site-specific recombinase XerD